MKNEAEATGKKETASWVQRVYEGLNSERWRFSYRAFIIMSPSPRSASSLSTFAPQTEVGSKAIERAIKRRGYEKSLSGRH